MARKIIPLKYKKSPLRFDGSDLPMGLGSLWDIFGGGESALEGQFQTAKDKLIETEVDQNFYKDLVNPYAGLTDQMAGLENTAEDLTINQRQFGQQERMLQRSLSSTLEASKRGGTQNAQAIANQLAQSSGDMAASIGDQERQNQLAKVSQASELQKLKAQSAQQLQMQKAQGEFQVDMQMRKGEEDALSRDLNKQQAILGLLSGEIARQDVKEEQDKTFLGINWKW